MNPAENYILNQPEPYRSILLHVQTIIESTVPLMVLKYKWNIPYYYLNEKPFCYFNASHKKQYVDIGFNKGFQLKVHIDHLIADGGRNTIKSLRYSALEEIDYDVLVAVLKEAATWY